MSLIKNDTDRRFRVWLSDLDAKKAGDGFYSFYTLRSCLESIMGSCAAHIERMETYALQGRFGLVEKEIVSFLDQLPKTKECFLNLITDKKDDAQ